MNDARQSIFNQAFELQKDVIRSKSKRKVLFIGRRSGKTFLIAIYMIILALSYPRIKIAYLGLTKKSAENAMWMHCLEELLLKFSISFTYNNSTKEVRFANGSIIRMTGCDSGAREIKKELGGKVFLAIIDECQDQTKDLYNIIKQALQPCVSDYIKHEHGGQIIMVGTAGQVATDGNYWFKITKNVAAQYNSKQEEWDIFHWVHTDNPHMKEQKLQELRDFERDFGPDYVTTDWFRTQYLCQWITDSDDKVYHFQPHCNILLDQQLIDNLLSNRGGHNYVLSTDLGHNDALAFSLLAYHQFEPYLYIVKSEKYHKVDDLDWIGKKLLEYRENYKIVYWPIDSAGSGKLIVEDYRRRYRIPFCYPKSKTDKHDFIRQMNSDLHCGKIKVIEKYNKELIEEWNTVMLDKRALELGYRKEADKYHNDACDAALYGFSIAKHFMAKTPPPVDERSKMQIATEERFSKTYEQSIYQNNKDLSIYDSLDLMGTP
jgi:hypothetical protein